MNPLTHGTVNHSPASSNAERHEVERGGSGRRQPRFLPWSALSGHARARYLYAMARQIQKHSRLFAVLESLDNGKPIRESRDIDIPLVARHFYYHAGWAQLRNETFIGYEPMRGMWSDYPVEFSAVNACMENRPGTGRR